MGRDRRPARRALRRGRVARRLLPRCRVDPPRSTCGRPVGRGRESRAWRHLSNRRDRAAARSGYRWCSGARQRCQPRADWRRAMRPGMRYSLIVGALLVGSAGLAACGGSDEPEGDPLPAEVDAILTASARGDGRRDERALRARPLGCAGVHRHVRVARRSTRWTAASRRPLRPTPCSPSTVDGSLKTKLGAVAIDGDGVVVEPGHRHVRAAAGRLRHRPVARSSIPRAGGGRCSPSCRTPSSSARRTAAASATTIRGVAPAAQMEIITAGLVHDQDVAIDFWMRRDTGLVTAAEFTTTFEGADHRLGARAERLRRRRSRSSPPEVDD